MTIHKVNNKSGKTIRSGLSAGKSIITTPSPEIIQSNQTSRIKNALGRNIQSSGGISSGGRQLFLDTCDSATLPSGVVTTNTPQYDSTLKARSFLVNNSNNYQCPTTGTMADDLFMINSFISPSTITGSAPFIDVLISGTIRYSLAFQSDGNIVLYRDNFASAPWATSFTGGGTPFAASENWRQEFSININRVRWRMWRDDWVKSYDSGIFGHSFTPSSSDTVQFRLNFCDTNFNYLSINKF